MHIVAVTGYYYPYMVPPAGCAKHYLVELAKDNTVEIICPSSNNHYKESLVKDGIKINYINSVPNKLLSFIKTCQEDNIKPGLTKFLFFLYRGLRYLKSKFVIEPYDTSLIPHYVRGLESIHKGSPIDVIMSVSFNFYTHAATLEFKRLHPEVRWITYSTDPLAYNEVNIVEKWKLSYAKEMERKVYSSCDYCITTEEMYPNIVNDYKIDPNKVLGLPFLLLDKPLKGDCPDNELPRVVYAGYLYNDIRNPKTMLEIFSRIRDVNLFLNVEGDRFIREMLKKGFPDNIHIGGLVSREKYLELIGTADVLINMCNKVKLQAPSKLIELISTGKPIINFYYNMDSGFRMIEKYPLGINISNDVNPVEAATRVSAFISANAKKSIPFDEIKALYPAHSLSNQMPKVRKAFVQD